jgi:hypothetical protein
MTTRESTVPLWIPSWEEYSEILSILNTYERGHESFAGTMTFSTGSVAQKLDPTHIMNRVKSEFFQVTLGSFPMSSLINRLGVWLTEDATAVSLIPEDLDQLREYVCRAPDERTRCGLPLSDEEFAFCEKQGLFTYLPVAEALIRAHFPGALEVRTELMKDPEAEGEWLVIGVKVDGEIEAVLDSYDRLTQEWVEKVPWPDREKIVIDYTIT